MLKEESVPNELEGRPPQTFSIGVCASGRARNLPALIARLVSEPFAPGFALNQIVVVASGCEEQNLARVRLLTRDDQRIVLIEEGERRGKAEAVNRIVEAFWDDYLVLVNGDAFPERGSIQSLLTAIAEDPSAGAVSGAPTFATPNDMVSGVVKLIWALHNGCALSLNHLGISNHGSDELIVLRSEAVQKLPTGLVNDGGYLTGCAYSRGYKIRFCTGAPVNIDVPRRFVDLIHQRRRILFGHVQVWRLLGREPRTIETMLVTTPGTSLSILVKTLARTPRLICALPVAVVGEMIATIGTIWDVITSTRRHVVWRRYDE